MGGAGVPGQSDSTDKPPPAPGDLAVIARINAAGAIVGIDLLVPIIFNRSGPFSFLDEGALQGRKITTPPQQI